jgi:plastocyanin
MKRSVIAAILLISAAGFSTLMFGDSALGSKHGSQPQPTSKIVTITNFQFSPKTVTIKAGAEVSWEVKEGTHTVTADNSAFESQALSAGQKFNYKFTKPGTYRYYCSFHGSKGGHDMAGTVNVTR